ncbi:MAG TPA: hypothetical protein VLV88_07750 [Terriglobales bacterium]|nr:hypothetical protein [Terriglobales bacterium]
MDHEVFPLMNSGRTLTAVPAIAEIRRRNRPIWMWWQLLSLDAPTVAVVWALLFARCAGAPLRAGKVFALAAMVWLIYAADRVADGIIPRPGERLEERHRFYARHTFAVCCFGVFLLVMLAYLFVVDLGSLERQATLWLLWAVTIYFVWIHVPFHRLRPGVMKGIVVGLIFACGTVLMAWTQAGKEGGRVGESAVVFWLLCSLNCIAIEHWEHESETKARDVRADFRKEGARKGGNARRFLAYMFAAASACMVVILANSAGHPFEIFLASSGLAAALLGLIHSLREGISGEDLRVLADAALVLPALLALLRIG